MKTFSREHQERQFESLSIYNPLIKIMLPFDTLLTSPMQDVAEDIDRLTSFNVKNDMVAPINPELIKVVLQEINLYGHATVLQVDYDNLLILDTETSMASIRECVDHVVVNVKGEEFYVELWDYVSRVTIAGKKYSCKHISVVSDDSHVQLYVTLSGEPRLFIAEHSGCCQSCHNMLCKKHNKAGILLPDHVTGQLRLTPKKPNEVTTKCSMFNSVDSILQLLGSVLVEYQYRRDAIKEGRRSRSKTTETASTEKVSKSSSPISVVERSTGEEIFIRLNKYASTKSEYKGGHHNSPVVHEVDGYWRRKSKNDPTLIFVESFPRGGTKEERDKLKASGKKKQIVYNMK